MLVSVYTCFPGFVRAHVSFLVVHIVPFVELRRLDAVFVDCSLRLFCLPSQLLVDLGCHVCYSAPSGCGSSPCPFGSSCNFGPWLMRFLSFRLSPASASFLLWVCLVPFKFPTLILCKKKIPRHIKLAVHVWSTKCLRNQKLIAQFGCTLRDERFEPN